MGRFIDLTGRRFGKWIVIKRVGNDTRGGAKWLCLCDCGVEGEVPSNSLASGNSISCGCSRLKDLTGKKFGRWTVIKRVNSRNRETFWLCRCECGKEKEIWRMHLIRGKSKSCGCLAKETASKRHSIEYGLAAKNRIYGIYKRGAEKRNLFFELSFDQFISLTQQNCHYCDIEPFTISYSGRSNGDYTYNGVDRKDNSKGYTLKNCVPCCSPCNYAKGDTPYEKFIGWGKRLGKHLIQMEEDNES
jgi:hypothetical protein